VHKLLTYLHFGGDNLKNRRVNRFGDGHR